MYELVYQGRTYCSPSLSQLVKHLNLSITDGSKRFYQPTMNAVVHGHRKSHHGATARMCAKSEYMQAEDTTFVPALSRDQYVMRRRPKQPAKRPRPLGVEGPNDQRLQQVQQVQQAGGPCW